MGDHKSHASSLVETFNNDDWDAASRIFGTSTYNELGTQRSLKGADIPAEITVPHVMRQVTAADCDPDRVAPAVSGTSLVPDAVLQLMFAN